MSLLCCANVLYLVLEFLSDLQHKVALSTL